ncbi:AMP-binding protein [Hamadaea tsunoensis]|uniref:AMP-binding protein n=1 Tax=Hamadaea tsunoensis TaxID=53368 RepID=UPI0003FCB380|nr:AMP-binding protein [Hamadaea tsunoensis]
MTIDSIVTGFGDHARRTPDAPALADRASTVTYGELDRLVAAAADRLAGHSAGPVAVPAVKSPRTVATVLAGLRTRRPVLLLSPTLPEPTIAEIVERAGCAVIADGDGWRAGPGGGTEVAPGLLLTTSGSTGVPKIVPLADQATYAFARWADETFGLGPGRRVLNYAPLNFDLCLLDVWGTLAAGGCCVLVDERQATNPRQLAGLVGDVQVVQGVPLLFELLATAGTVAPGVEHVIVTGDAIRAECLARLPEMFPNAARYNVYGCTETNDSFIGPLDPGVPIVLGSTLPGVQALVMTDGGALAGDGEGELWVSTPFQTAGYLHGALAEKFAVRDGVRYFRSGDLVRRSGAELSLVGRTDFQVKVAGQRVNLQEVEACLLAHPEVTEAAVVAVRDERYGHRLYAAVRRRPGGLDSLELRRHCAQRLPGAAIPGWFSIGDAALPRTSTGKVDRNQIRTDLSVPR